MRHVGDARFGNVKLHLHNDIVVAKQMIEHMGLQILSQKIEPWAGNVCLADHQNQH